MATKKSKKKTDKSSTRMVQNDRVKTDVRLSPDLMLIIEKIVKKVGATKNSFFTLAATRACADLVPLIFKNKAEREKVLRVVEEEFQKALDQARSA